MSKKTYTAAYDELQDILEKLQGDNVSIEDLSKMIKRSEVLVKICKEKLRTVELDIEGLLAEDQDD